MDAGIDGSEKSPSPGKYTHHQKLFYISLSEEEWQKAKSLVRLQISVTAEKTVVT